MQCRKVVRIVLGCAVLLWHATPASGASSVELDLVGDGPYAVGCSNVEQDFSRALHDVSSYWEGARDDVERYVSDLLVEPEFAIRYVVRPPDDRTLFRNFRTRDVEFVALVCYPTTDDNPRASFMLPDGSGVPAMQRGDEAPILAERCSEEACPEPSRWPLLLYSHGLGGSPLGGDYLSTMARFASHGYVVAAPFHADARISRIELEDMDDLRYLLMDDEELVEMQAIRPLALQGLLDHLLARPDFGPLIDSGRIAGFGASLGGESMMLLAGAELTTDFLRSRKEVTREPRLRAILGFVPYSGVSVLPAFGDEQRGTRGVTAAYIGVAGTDDDVAPLDMTEEAVDRLQGTRYLVAVRGMAHGHNPEVMDEAYAWYLTFLDANLNGDRAALSRLYRATRVAGGSDDRLEIAVQKAVPALADETVVREFYHAGLNHYFLSAEDVEVALLLAHPEYGWFPTGRAFSAASAYSSEPGFSPVCRFYGDPSIGPNSHFFTGSALECAGLVALRAAAPPGFPAWNLEGIGFSIRMPDALGQCPDAAPFPVLRAYNGYAGEVVGGVRRDANHRYATDPADFNDGGSDGWLVEGVAFCTSAPLVPSS
ncbi:alpha/beta hydrolase family protein [Thauera aromatica]|nr:hypothetical protein [Thauera aromatica]